MLFNTETSSGDTEEAKKMHAQQQRAAIFALQTIAKNKGIPDDLNSTVQTELGMDPEHAHLAVEDAKRSLAQDPESRVWLGLGKSSLENKDV